MTGPLRIVPPSKTTTQEMSEPEIVSSDRDYLPGRGVGTLAAGDDFSAGSGPQRATERHGTPQPPETPYLQRLVMLIPSEVITLYLFGIGLLPDVHIGGLAIWAAVCLGVVIILRAAATRDPQKTPSIQWGAVMVSSVSFVLWVFTLPGPLQGFGFFKPQIGSLAIGVWTVVVPRFYKG